MRLLAPAAAAAALLCGSYVGHAQTTPAPRGTATPPSASAPPPSPASPSASASAPLPPPPPPLDSTAAPAVGAQPAPSTATGAPPQPPPPYPYPYPPPPREEQPDVMPYQDGYLVPPGYHVETRMRRAPVIAGAVMLGAGYGLAAAVGATSIGESNEDELLPLFIPIVGPFITLGSLDFRGDFGAVGFVLLGIPLILDGLIQAAGAVALTAGLTSPKQVLVRDGALATVTPRLRIKPTGVEWRF